MWLLNAPENMVDSAMDSAMEYAIDKGMPE